MLESWQCTAKPCFVLRISRLNGTRLITDNASPSSDDDGVFVMHSRALGHSYGKSRKVNWKGPIGVKRHCVGHWRAHPSFPMAYVLHCLSYWNFGFLLGRFCNPAVWWISWWIPDPHRSFVQSLLVISVTAAFADGDPKIAFPFLKYCTYFACPSKLLNLFMMPALPV